MQNSALSIFCIFDIYMHSPLWWWSWLQPEYVTVFKFHTHRQGLGMLEHVIPSQQVPESLSAKLIWTCQCRAVDSEPGDDSDSSRLAPSRPGLGGAGWGSGLGNLKRKRNLKLGPIRVLGPRQYQPGPVRPLPGPGPCQPDAAWLGGAAGSDSLSRAPPRRPRTGTHGRY